MNLMVRVTTAAVLPFLFFLVVVAVLSNRIIRTERTSLQREDEITLSRVEERFQGITVDLATSGAILAQNDDTARAVSNRNHRTLYRWSRLFQSSSISWVMFFDTDGVVLSRSDDEYSFSQDLSTVAPVAAALQKERFQGLLVTEDGVFLVDARPVLLYGEVFVGGVMTAANVTGEFLASLSKDADISIELVVEGRRIVSNHPSRTPRARLPLKLSTGDGPTPQRAEIVFYPSQNVQDLVGLQRQLLVVMSLLSLVTAGLVVIIVRTYLRPYTDLVRELLLLARGRVPYESVPRRFEQVFPDSNHEAAIIASAVADFVQTIHTNMIALERLSTTDPLTGLSNRRHMEDILEAECSRAERYSTPFAVLLTDIDNFKTINDTFGHQTGDTVLVRIADRMKELTRETDTIARWGGEEFLLLSPERDLNGAVALAEKLRQAIDDTQLLPGPVPAEPHPVGTASFGVAVWKPGDGPESLLRRADALLYTAKRSGRNRVVSEPSVMRSDK